MKILFVGEFSQISTGYGKITSELIQRFYKDGYDVAELANFCGKDDPRIQKCNWKVYPNLPSNEEENHEYSSNQQNSNGRWKFEEVLLDYRPNFVFGNGDPFMYEYQMHSPFRKYFNWIITAPVDGIPQHNQWIHIFNDAEGLTTYTDWGKTVLESYNITVNGVTPPVASDDFFPISLYEITKFKESIKIDDKIIIGTVMRNQPRKLFDKLFDAFSRFDKKHILYCHTTYPDAGWDLGELLLKHKILNRVLFTYKCKACNQSYASVFQDIRTFCPFCKEVACKMPDGQDAVDNKTLNKIINIFDIYVQLASREGFGIPQIEAAACDIPIVTVDYAGMSDIIKYLDAYPINKTNDYLSYPMNMIEANPSIDDIVNTIKTAISDNLKGSGKFRKKYEEHYQSWDRTYQTFKSIVDKLPIKNWQKEEIHAPPEYSEIKISNEDYAKFLMIYVLGRPDFVGSYLMARIIRDLNAGITFGGICGNYFTESIEQRNYQPFDRKNAYDLCFNKRKYDDYWKSKFK